MNLRSFLRASALLLAAAAPVARALPITYIQSQGLTTSDKTELGRASRSGVYQTWAGNESYTGQINTATTYYYTTYVIPWASFYGAHYIDINVTDVTGNGYFFVSAFAVNYDPNNRGQNWLGDVGSSGEYAFYAPPVPGDDRFFDVVLPGSTDLVLLVNSTLGGTNGLNNAFNISVNAFTDDQNYNDPLLTPEPGSLVLALTGVAGTVAAARRRLFGRL